MFLDKFSLFFFSLFKPQEKHYILLFRLKTRPIVYTSEGIYDLIKELQKLEKSDDLSVCYFHDIF